MTLPCPGMSEPESLTPASRLIIDSVRSPKTDPKKLRNPKAIELRKPKTNEPIQKQKDNDKPSSI